MCICLEYIVKALGYRFRTCVCVVLKTMRMNNSYRNLGGAQGEYD